MAQAPLRRGQGPLAGLGILALVAALLVAEGLIPGRALLPLTPDDFPTWAAGRSSEELRTHPHPNWCMSDVLHLFLPGLATTRAAWDRGELPLWDPTQALGVPHIDQVHYAVYYPPAWLALVLGLPGLGLMAWLHLVAAAGGMLFYLRALKRTPAAAMVGALAFAFSAWMTARVHAFPVVGAAVWLPWILWGLQVGAAEGRRLGHVVAALATALSLLAGMPQITMLALLLVGVVELVRFLVTLRSEAKRALLSGGQAALALVLGGLLAAPQWVPTRDYMENYSARQQQTPEALATEALEPVMLAHLVAPDYYATAGLPGRHPLAMRDSVQARQNPVGLNRAETSLGIGVLGLLLALGAMIFGRQWTTRTYAGVAIVVLLLLFWPPALVGAARVLTPLQYGSPRRLLLLSTFALSVLAAGGLDLMRLQRLRTVAACWVASLAATAYGLVLLVGVPSTEESLDVDNWATSLAAEMGLGDVGLDAIYAVVPPESFAAAADAATRSAVVAFAAALAGLLLFRPRSVPSERGWSARVESVPGLIPLLMTAELFLAAWPMLRAAPTDGVTTEPGRIDRLRVPALASAARGVVADAETEPVVPPRVWRTGNEPSWLRPNFAGLFGLHDVQAYAPMLPLRTAELLEAVAPGTHLSGSILGGVLDGQQLSRPAVDMLGVDAVFTDDPALLPEGFEEREQVGSVRVLANTEALPRAHVVQRVHVVPFRGRRLARLAELDFDPRSTAVLGERPADLPGVQVFESGEGGEPVVLPPLPADAAAREATMIEYGPGRMRLQVAAGPPGLLVVSESHHDGWRARVAGREVTPLVANHALLGVPLATAEAVEVELVFEPAAQDTGLMLGLAGLAGLLVFGVVLPVVSRLRHGPRRTSVEPAPVPQAEAGGERRRKKPAKVTVGAEEKLAAEAAAEAEAEAVTEAEPEAEAETESEAEAAPDSEAGSEDDSVEDSGERARDAKGRFKKSRGDGDAPGEED